MHWLNFWLFSVMCPSTSDIVRLQALPNKGFGLVATRDITASELIVAESPLLKVKLSPEGDLEGQFVAVIVR